MNRCLMVLVALCMGWNPAIAWSQAPTPWPSKPVRMVVPFAAGSNADATARIVSERLAPSLGQPVIIETRAGANQAVATAFVVKSPADGYTLLFAVESIVYEHLLEKTVPFVALRDLTPVTRVAGAGNVFLIPADFPAKTLGEFIARVKASPGKFNFATNNNFELPEMLEFRERMGMQMVLVAYANAPQAIQSVLVGEAHMFLVAPDQAVTATAGGKARAIAYSGKNPHFLLPNVPTVGASKVGFDDYESMFKYVIFVPTGTPQAVISRLNDLVGTIVQSPDGAKRFHDLGLETNHVSAPELNAALAAKTKQIEGMLARGIKLR